MARARRVHGVGALEFALHSTVVLCAALSFAVWGFQFSRQFERGQAWDGYAPGLKPGIILGRRVDLSDNQWREFRAGLPVLAVFFGGSALVSRYLQHRGISVTGRAFYYVLVALAFLGYLHGVGMLHVLALAATNYGLAHAVAGRPFGAIMLWICNVVLLVAVRLTGGFRLGHICTWLAPLDRARGVMRWEICFNLSMLRMLSFAIDLHWCKQQRPQQQPTPCHSSGNSPQLQQARHDVKHARNHASDAPRRRQQASLPSSCYGLLVYLAYVLFPPLYLAGPIITFQDFVWQLHQQQAPTARMLVRYGARFAADLLCLELLTHCLYFNSLAKYRVGLQYRQYGLQYGAAEMGMTAFWVLCFMWLKFATIWRFFRFASLLDGIDPPENMLRCFANNYDIEGFWRGWHASFNQWLVRYLYIPLGGSRQRGLVVWPIFLFVAIWHDLEWRMLSWAWLVCLVFVPEMAVKNFAKSARFDSWRHTTKFRHLCAVGAAINMIALMIANLCGFVLGLNGLQELLRTVLADHTFVASAVATFFSAANIMFWLRAWGATS